MKKVKKGLGRGLEVLLGSVSDTAESIEGDYRILPLDQLNVGKYQPRLSINQQALKELSESIRVQGLLQPILVQKISDQRYEILAGERRFRAAKLAELTEIPVLIKKVSNEAAITIALIENIQRENLNALEEAQGVERLIQEFKFTHEKIAQALGRSRSAISNLLRLLQLPKAVQELLSSGQLDMGHARALLALAPEQQIEIAQQVVQKELSVRDTEKMVHTIAQSKQTKERNKKSKPSHYSAIQIKKNEQKLSTKLKHKVKIHIQPSGDGTVIIHFNNQLDLESLIATLRI